MALRREIQDGVSRHEKQEYFEDFGYTMAVCLRLTNPCLVSNAATSAEPQRVVGADSCFIGVITVQVMHQKNNKSLFG